MESQNYKYSHLPKRYLLQNQVDRLTDLAYINRAQNIFYAHNLLIIYNSTLIINSDRS